MAVNSYRDDEQMDHTSRKKIIRRLLGYLFAFKGAVLGVMVLMAGAIAISLLNPLLIEEALDNYIARRDFEGLVRLGILALALNLVYIVLVKIRMYEMSVVSNKILLRIRQDLYEHIQTLSFSFFDSRPTGKILARIIGDVNALKDVFVNAVTTLIPEFVTVAGVVVIMVAKDWRLAAASLSTLPIMAAGVWMVQKASHRRWQIYRKKSSNLNAYVHEDLAGMRVVQSFQAQDEMNEIFSKLTDEHRDSFQDACRYADLFGPVVDFCWGIGAMMLYLVGVRVLGIGQASVGLLVAFGSYINMFWNPILNLSSFYNNLITNLTAAERIFDILDTQPDITDREGVKELPPIQGSVEFSHVSFTYDKGTPAETKVLSDVSFQVRPGETIALVGPTGAGKTTIVNLISRFYDIEEGVIYVDGHNLTQVSIESFRRQMGVMTQDNFIFHGTIRDNILYGKPDATEEEMLAASKAVHAHAFIMEMEHGYDTELKEQGAGLSIGQRQLIAFARTMVSMPKILILDEATSSIDTHTELLVQEGIEALLAGRTSFVIAHRLSTIQNADRIFVIDNGGIMEQGSPKELMKKRELITGCIWRSLPELRNDKKHLQYTLRGYIIIMKKRIRYKNTGYMQNKEKLMSEKKIQETKAACCGPHTDTGKVKERTKQEYKDLIHRLNRIEGQVRGIRGMVEKDAYCTDILVQVAAVNAALNSFNKVLLANHIKTCVTRDIRDGKEDTVDELVAVLQKLMK